MNDQRIVYLVIGRDGTVRGFPYTTAAWADEARREADTEWSRGAPHVVEAFVPARSQR